MAQRRMFSLQIVDTDAFLEMPASSQLLYFHLSMRADDDGFVANPKKIMRSVGVQEDDLKVLIAKRFILTFESGIIVIKHWRINNYIQNDRYNETKYLEEKKSLEIKDNGSYTERIQTVYTGKVSLGKDRLDKVSLEGEEPTPSEKAKKFFNDKQEFNRVLEELKIRGIQEKIATQELNKFISYWTEPNKSGTKQRWELEKTFDVARRLNTWFRNYQSFNSSFKSTNSNAIKL